MGEQMHRILEARWISFYNGLPNHITTNLTVDGLVCECPDVALYDVYEATASSLTDEVNRLYLPESVSVKNVFAADGVTPFKPVMAKQTEAFEGVKYIYE